MSVTIRLRRMGAKGQPSYRVVVTDSRNARDGRFIETIGFYNPRREPAEIRLDEAKVLSWLEQGATVSDTARSLMKKQGVWTRFTEGGVLTAEKRQALAARKERAEARRSEKRAARPALRAGSSAEKPATVETRSGRKKTVRKKEGMPPVSGREPNSLP